VHLVGFYFKNLKCHLSAAKKKKSYERECSTDGLCIVIYHISTKLLFKVNMTSVANNVWYKNSR